MSTNITYGADPEFFVRERATQTIIPACGLFGGEKGNPVLLSNLGGYLEDGVTIELNVAPAPDLQTVQSRLLELKRLWEQRFPQHELVCTPSAQFDKKVLRPHRSAMEIGCNADQCAWGVRRAPQISDFGTTRFAGGHIHIGIDPWPEGLKKEFLVRWLDIFALMPTIQSSSTDRFEHYGRPGLWRDTGYGIEWRSPDPYWVEKFQGSIADHAGGQIAFLLSAQRNWARVEERFNAVMAEFEVDRRLANPTIRTYYAFPRNWRVDLPSRGYQLHMVA